MNKIDIFQTQDFASLPQEKKTEVLTNYFNKNMADDSFKSLEAEKQSSILNNFINSQISLDNVQGKEAVQNIEKTENQPVDFSKVEEPKQLKKTATLEQYEEEKKPFLKKLLDKTIDYAKLGGSAIQDTVNILSPIGDFNVMGENYDNPITGVKGNKSIADKISEDGDLPLDAYNKINKLARTDIALISNKEDGVKTYNKNLADIVINDFGFDDLAIGNDGKYYAIKGDEKVELNKDTLKDIVSSTYGDKMEILGSIIGAKKGYDSVKNFGTKAKFVGGLVGGTMGAMTGTVADMLDSAIETGEKLNTAQFGNEIVKSAILDATGGAVTAGVIKIGGKIIELPKQARDYILNGNLNGAREILKKDLGVDEKYIEDALEQMKTTYKESDNYSKNIAPEDSNIASKVISKVGGDLRNQAGQQEELLATVLAKGDENIIRGALDKNETAARNLGSMIDNRAKQVIENLEENSSLVGGEEIKNYLNNFEQTAKQDFSNMRKDFSDAFKEIDYKFELEDLKLNETFRDMAKRVQDPDAKKRFLTLQSAIKNTIYDSNAQVGIERDISGLLDMRQQLNRFYGQNERYLTNKKDKDTFNSLKENLDNQIYKAVNDNLPPELGTRLIDSFSKSMDGYRQLGSLQENKVFKSIMGEANSPEFRLNNLVKHMADDDSYVDDVLSKMRPSERQTVEMAVIREISSSKKFLKKGTDETSAIAFEDLGKQLSSIKHNIRSELGKETIDNLIAYGEKFGNRDVVFLDAAKGIVTKKPTSIATTVEGKSRMMIAGAIFDYLQALKPTKTGQRLALQRHIGKALEKTRTPNEFATKLYEYPDLTDESRNILKSMIKNNNKILAAKNDKEAERLLIEAQEKNQKLINDQEALKEEIENFKTPDINELRVVSRLTDDNKFASFSQLTTRIAQGKATQPDIEQYIKARNTIKPDILEKNILKEKYPENAFSIHKLNDLKSFANEKVNEIISENEFKSLIFNLDKHNKLPNTSTEMENKYREKFYQLHKLYEEEKALKEIEKQTVEDTEKKAFEEAEKAGLIPFAKFGDNLLAGTVAGVETDEDGNIVGFDPEMFVVGLGGYTALKTALKNKEIQGALKDYALKIVEYVDMNPAIYKQNGLNAMFVGAKPNEQGAFSDVATKKVMREIDDSKAILNTRNIDNVKNNLGINEVSPISGIEYTKNADGTYEVLLMNKNAKNTNQIPKLTLKDNELKTYFNDEQIAKIRNDYGDDYSDLYDDGKLHKYFKTDGIFNPNSGGKLSDYIQHDELFKKYPELKDLDTAFSNDVKGAYLGSAEHPDGSIKPIMVIGRSNIEGDKSLLLHEIQHAIQNKEGWARGGNPEEFTNNLSDNFLKEYSNKYSVAEKKVNELSQKIFDARFNDIPDSELSKLKQDYEIAKRELTAIEDSKVLEQSKTKHEKYQSLWGEQQARATQQRMNYTPEQRASEDWTKTLANNEGKYNEPIIKFDDKTVNLKAEKENLARLTKWHKDSHLLTKNEDGTPKVFYHGTTKDFNEFKGNTIWAAEDSKLAYEYALKDSNFNSMGNGENIIPVYINAKNILEIRKPTIKQTEFDFAIEIINNNTSKFKNDKELKEKLLKNIDKLDNETEKPVFEIWDSNKAVVEILKDLGYDGISTTEGASKTVGIFSPEQIKSINNRGTFDKTNPNIMMSQSAKDYKDNQGFYSVLEKTVDEKVGGKIDSVSLAKVLEKNGVKQDELEWSGLKDLLDSKDKLTKEEIQNTINENRLVLEKVEKIDKAKYKNYKMDGGENYREILFTMPIKDKNLDELNNLYLLISKNPKKYTEESAEYKRYLDLKVIVGNTFNSRPVYYSNHWKESNIVVFTRVDDRTIDNKKTLFIEELQSDWHQDGRKKGYGNKKSQVPDAPFKKNWHELGLKRMIQEAVENDYEKIAWTTGKQQASRYSLEKEIDTVVYNKQSGYLQASKNGDEVIFKKVASDEEVANLLGKEITNRLIDPKQSTRENIFVLQGEDVKFGGDGMKAFYDEIVPNTAKKLFKKYNVKPKLEELDDLEEMVWSVEITPKMKEDIKKYGQPLYAIGGALAIGNELSNNGDKDE